GPITLLLILYSNQVPVYEKRFLPPSPPSGRNRPRIAVTPTPRTTRFYSDTHTHQRVQLIGSGGGAGGGCGGFSAVSGTCTVSWPVSVPPVTFAISGAGSGTGCGCGVSSPLAGTSTVSAGAGAGSLLNRFSNFCRASTGA